MSLQTNSRLQVEAGLHVVIMLLLVHMLATRSSRRAHWSAGISAKESNGSETYVFLVAKGVALTEFACPL